MTIKEQDLFEKVLNMLCDNKKVHSLETLYKVKFVCERLADKGRRESVSEYLADKEKIKKLLEDDIQMYESAESRYRKYLKQTLICFLEEERKDVLKSEKRYYFSNKELIKCNKMFEIQEDRNKRKDLKKKGFDKLDFERDIKEIFEIIEEFYLTKEICLDFMQIDEEDPYLMFDQLRGDYLVPMGDDEITDPDGIATEKLRDEIKNELIKAGLVKVEKDGRVMKKKLSGRKKQELFEIEKKTFFNIPYSVWNHNKTNLEEIYEKMLNGEEFREFGEFSDAIIYRMEEWYGEVCKELKCLSKKDIGLLAKRNITKEDVVYLEERILKKWRLAIYIENVRDSVENVIDEWGNFIFETEDVVRAYRYYKEMNQMVEEVCDAMRDKLEFKKIKRKSWKAKNKVKKLRYKVKKVKN